jgi:hypothetical protein
MASTLRRIAVSAVVAAVLPSGRCAAMAAGAPQPDLQTSVLAAELASILRREQKKDLPQIRALVEQGAPVATTSPGGRTSLMVAARYGDVPLIGALLRRGAAVDQQDDAGFTALFFADDPVIVRLLVSAGAQTNHRSRFGTPLILAADGRRTDVLIALIHSGADLNAHNERGETALHRATARARVTAVMALLAYGADSRSKDFRGETPLDWSRNWERHWMGGSPPRDPELRGFAKIGRLLRRSRERPHTRGAGRSSPGTQSVPGGSISSASAE